MKMPLGYLRYFGVSLALWTLLLVMSFLWNFYREGAVTEQVAREQALNLYYRDTSLRHWVASVGGIYVEVSDELLPHPLLAQIPERDIVTPSGRTLTLINPAYAFRLVQQHYDEMHGESMSQVTSLNPTNPQNQPDDWQAAALLAFEQGASEMAGITAKNGRQVYRYMRPLVLEEACLKCHDEPYPPEGNRGGISFDIEIEAQLAQQQRHEVLVTLSHIVLWASGGLFFAVWIWRERRAAEHIAESREQLKQAVALAEDTNHSLIEAMHEGMVMQDAEGRVIDCNPAAEHILGLSRAEMRSQGLDSLLPLLVQEDGSPCPAEAFPATRALRSGLGCDGVILGLVRYPQERLRWLSLNADPISDGRIKGVILTLKDITQARLSESQLRKALLRQQSMFNNSSVGIFLLNDQGRISDINYRALEMLGYTRDQLVGQSSSLICAATALAGGGELFDELTRQGGRLSFDYPLRCNDGHEVWCHLSLGQIDANDVYQGAVAVVTDIDELRHTETRLLESERRLRTLIEGTPDLICIKDPQGRIIEANRVYVATLGMEKLAYLGKRCVSLMGQIPQCFHEFLHECLRLDELAWENGGTVRKEISVPTLTGLNRVVDFYKVPVFDGAGQPSVLLTIGRDISDRRRLEERLHTSREGLKLALRAAHAGTFHQDFVSGRQVWDDRCLEIFGLTKKALRLDPGCWRRRINPDDLEAFDETMRLASAHHSRFDLVYRILLPDGRERYLRSQAFLTFAEGVDPISISGLVFDVTEEHKRGEELQRVYDLLDDTQSMANVGGWEINSNKNSVYWTREMYRIHEVDDVFRPSLESVVAFFGEKHRTKITAAIQQAMEVGEAFDLILPLTTAKGQQRQLRYLGKPLRREGELVGVRGACHDITQRQQYEDQLRKHNRQLELVSKAGREFTATLELDEVFDRILHEALDLLNATSSSLWLREAGRQQTLICRHCVGSNAACVLKKRLRVGQGITGWVAQHNESLLVAETRGDPRHYKSIDQECHQEVRSMVLAPLTYGRENIGVLVCVDMEPGKFSEDDQYLLNGIANAAAGAIHSARLYDEAKLLRERAESANRAKTAFLANMSHELRTPLGAILGYAQTLEQYAHIRPDEQRKLATIRHSGEYLLSMINELLDLAKIEAGRLELNPDSCNLRQLLQQLVDMFMQRAGEKGLRFEYRGEALCASVVVDQKRLRQVIVNLLSNAVKFTEEGCITLYMGCQQGNLLVSVEDTGAGIPLAEQNEVFQPFRQTGDTRYKAAGTGLGLAISRRLVDAMGGQIELTSEPGKGSRFSFRIPAPPGDSSAIESPSVADPSGHQDVPLLEPLAAHHQAQALSLLEKGKIIELNSLLEGLAQQQGPSSEARQLLDLSSRFRLADLQKRLARQPSGPAA